MTINVVPSIAESAGGLWKELQTQQTGEFSVAAPLSSTPLPVYEWVINNAHDFGDWSRVKFVLMDEQVDGENPPFRYVAVGDAASYEGFARKHFLDPLRARTGVNVGVLKPDLESMTTFAPPIDLLVLALGVKGNYANVMPGTHKTTGWHVAHLIDEFRQVHTQAGSQSYENANFREYGMSLGPQQVLSAKNVVVIISGGKKLGLTEQLLSHKKFDPEFPLSIIYHPAVVERVQIFIQEDVGIEIRNEKTQ